MKMTLSRMCVITRKRMLRTKMVKITRVNESWFVDKGQNLFGRSIYIDLNKDTLDKFSKQQKRFKMNKEEFEVILEELEELCAK